MRRKINEITVGRRFRKDFGDIEALAASLARYGQLQPIIVTAEGELVAGERRLRAAMSLNWEEVDTVLREDLGEADRKEVELEENIRRKEFTWPEEVLALLELYEMKRGKYGVRVQHSSEDLGYGLKDASEELDRSMGSISMDLMLAQALKEYPTLALEKSKAAAIRKYKLMRETVLRKEIAARTRGDHIDEEVEASSEPQVGSASVRKAGFKGHGIIYFGDARTVLRSMPEDSVDCIITDPPFALGLFEAGDETSGARLADSAGGMYDDNPFRVLDMLDAVFEQCARMLKPGGHAYIFFHHNQYDNIVPMLEKHFPDAVESTPIIWVKNTSGIGDPNRTYVYAYEPMIFINKGRALQKPQAFNYLRYDTVPPAQKTHPTEKPAQLLRHLVSASCVPQEVVLDPFAGSGSTLVAAVQQGCKFIGVELEEKFYARCVDRLAIEIAALPELTK